MARTPQTYALRLLLLMVVSAGPFLAHAYAGEEAIKPTGEEAVKAAGASSEITFTTDLLVDPTRVLKLKDVLKPEVSGRFERQFSIVSLGYRKEAFWLRLTVENPAAQPLIMHIGKANLDQLTLYQKRDDGSHYDLVENTGTLKARKIDHREYYIALNPTDTPEHVDLLMRVASSTSIMLPISFASAVRTIEQVNVETAILGAYFGMILGLAFYNLFLFFQLHERVYLFYTLFLFTFAAIQTSSEGILQVNFPYNPLNFKAYSSAVLGNISAVFITLFVSEFLQLRRGPAAFRIFIRIFLTAVTAFTLVTPLIAFKTAIITHFAFGATAVCLIVVASAWAIRLGYVPARYFLLGLAALMTSTVLVGLAYIGLIPYDWARSASFHHITKVGSAIDILFFSFALADRFNVLTKTTQAAQAKLLEEEVRRRGVERQMAQEAAKAAQYMAIAQMIQSLAHDIRKPFSMLKMGLQRLSHIGDDPTEVHSVVQKIQHHVGQAFDHVNNMIADVMDVGPERTNIHPEPVSVSTMLAEALNHSFRSAGPVDVAFAYELNHRWLTHVDAHKMQRVLGNLLDNARQSMKSPGVITIKSRLLHTSESSTVEVTVHNTGSFIVEEVRGQIFDAFFTKDKKGGTGLGLAICHKIVEAHGGKIRCESSQGGGTAFIFTVPAVPSAVDTTQTQLPKSSQEVLVLFERSLDRAVPTTISVKAVAQREAILNQVRLSGRRIELLVVDDEPLYIDGIRAQLRAVTPLNDGVNFAEAHSADAALALCHLRFYDMAIVDIDLGHASLSGLELVRALRTLFPTMLICVHSNRDATVHHKQSIHAGADAFIPKPMNTIHLIALMAEIGKHQASA